LGRFFIRTRAVAVFSLFLGLVLTSGASAQELKVQATPFSVWLDFKALSAPNARANSFPIWLEKFEIHPAKTADGNIARTTYRIRFREFSGINEELLLRLYFDDLPQALPVVTAWAELGVRVFGSEQIGQGLGLESSQSLVVPMSGVDYLEIVVPGNGSNVRGAFLSTLKSAKTKHALDFDTPATVDDPFENQPGKTPSNDDLFLFGRVKATLEAQAVKLAPQNNYTATIDFELQTQPLLALVTFEILTPDVTAAPEFVSNNQPLGPAALIFPDLADPAYVGAVYSLERDMRFRYTGWIRGQKLLPGSALRAGVNQLSLQMQKSVRPVAIRGIEIQLKYADENLDYTLKPR
jgi:hypothetical protein